MAEKPDDERHPPSPKASADGGRPETKAEAEVKAKAKVQTASYRLGTGDLRTAGPSNVRLI